MNESLAAPLIAFKVQAVAVTGIAVIKIKKRGLGG